MVYITVKQSPIYRQMTLEELLFQNFSKNIVINDNTTNTKTYQFDHVSRRRLDSIDTEALIASIAEFNRSTQELREKSRDELYRTFHIPKKSGGLRRIDAPNPELMNALRNLKTILEEEFHLLYHTSAFAYVKGRSTIDAIKRHQANNSKWFAKLDLHNFFGSTDIDFVMKMFSMIFPLSEVIKSERGRSELQTALSLAFLNGVLPQGTPLSPLITNVMMIPVDFQLYNTLHNFNGQKFVYTRYADDFTISSRYDFNPNSIEDLIVGTLQKFTAPFSLNAEKTRYGSSAGRNWNLGVMLNKDNQITVGHKKKRIFQSMLHNYIQDKKAGKPWSKEDIQVMHGQYSYYRMVEGETIDAIIGHINTKMGVDVVAMMRDDMK